MRILYLMIGGFVSFIVCVATAWAEMPKIKAAVLANGTVNWELSTIISNKLDQKNGFELIISAVAGGPAGKIAFQGGEADVFVSDWLWVARQRAAGKDYIFIPYSTAVGGVVVKNDSDIITLADLKGKKIGIAGGPLDKSWLILRAYAKQEYGFDLRDESEQVFGAPPLIFKTALQGETDAAINFWHFMAKMRAKDMRTLLSVSEAATALGLDPDTPLLGYVLRGEMLKTHPDLVAGLAQASREAKHILNTDDAAWIALRPDMRVKTEAEFQELIAGFRAGIPQNALVDEAAANKMLQIMAQLGGAELVGDLSELPQGVFFQPGS